MKPILVFVFFFTIVFERDLLAANNVNNAALPNPVYLKTVDGFRILYGLTGEFVKFDISDAKPVSPDRLLLATGAGVSVSFADKKNFSPGKDLLGAHLKWEVDYWKNHASSVGVNIRPDLQHSKNGVQVAQFALTNEKRQQMTVYMISLASQSGVVVLGISCPQADPRVEKIIQGIVQSEMLVARNLDAREVKQQALALKAGQTH